VGLFDTAEIGIEPLGARIGAVAVIPAFLV